MHSTHHCSTTNDVYKSKKILLSINFNTDDKDNPGLTMEEMGDVTEFMNHFSADFELKWGTCY